MIYIFAVKLIVAFIVLKLAFVFALKKIPKIKLPFADDIPRQNLLKLAASDLFVLPRALFLFALFFWMSWSGFFILPNLQEINSGEGVFYSWLLNTDVFSLLICFASGFVASLIFRGFGSSIAVVTVLVFPFLISTPGAALIIFGDITAAWVLTFRKQNFKATLTRLLGSVVALSLFWVLGGVLRQELGNYGLNSFNPFDRSIQIAALISFLVAVDTAVSMVVFHFYFKKLIQRNDSVVD